MRDGYIFEGKAITIKWLDGDIAEIIFDLKDESVNKFNTLTITETIDGIKSLKECKNLKGVIATSAKDLFIVGADITEFLEHFKKPEQEMVSWLKETHQAFNDLEDLGVPSVSVINGICFGGGFEFCLATTYRVMADTAQVGLPETQLGIFPGWGGTIRLPRLIGADNAMAWICEGRGHKADAAFKDGAVDVVVSKAELREASLDLLHQAIKGKIDWQAKRREKLMPLQLRSKVEGMMVFEGAKGFVLSKVGKNYPAPIAAIEVMQKCASLTRDEAIDIEIENFIKMTKTPVAAALVGIFLSDQYVKRKAKKLLSKVEPVKKAAVLGAGIMGGGIAYQSASKGVSIYMKDIEERALESGVMEAQKLFSKQFSRKKISVEKMAKGISMIHPTLNYGGFDEVDIVVEAVVEHPDIKRKVLAEVESKVKSDTILASNTSTISISTLAEGLENPERFCGMHFFNPVHRMPLIEVIRGEKTSDETIAKVVSYAHAMGKKPIVVKDCPGFLVNRILFPYLKGFMLLMEDGVEFARIDKVMEKFGWPMGPAYLSDVVGLDTFCHAAKVMAKECPERMGFSDSNAIIGLVDEGRKGQKSGKGFYQYTLDKKGKPKKSVDETSKAIVARFAKTKIDISDEDIVSRLMIPMINEASLTLEEGIVETPMEVDLGLIYGLGFPAFRGGALRYVDMMGLSNFIEKARKYEELSCIYRPTSMVEQLASAEKSFYQFG